MKTVRDLKAALQEVDDDRIIVLTDYDFFYEWDGTFDTNYGNWLLFGSGKTIG